MNNDNLPKGWVWTTLGEICESAVKTQPKEHPEVEFTYIDIASIDNRSSKIVSPKIYVGKNAPLRARQVVKTGDILFSTVRTYLKNIALVDSRYDRQIASTGFCVIRPLMATTEFIFWMTLSNGFLFFLNKIQRGSPPAVRDSDVFSQTVPVPPENEQIRIVAKIEELFTKLDAGKEELLQAKARLKGYRQAVLKAAMEGKLTKDWRDEHRSEIEPASELLVRILKARREKLEAEQIEQMRAKGRVPKDDKWKKKYKEPQRPDTENLPELPDGWVWMTVGDVIEKVSISGGKLRQRDYKSEGKLPVIDQGKSFVGGYTNHQELKVECRLPVIVFGDHTRVFKYVDFDFVIGADGIKVIQPKKIYYPKLFYYFAQAISLPDKGYARHFQFLEKAQIPLPPILEQHRIVEEIESRLSVAEKVEATVEAELQRSDGLRQSILKKAFSGNLVPQDPNDEPASVLIARMKKEKAKREARKRQQEKPKRGLLNADHA